MAVGEPGQKHFANGNGGDRDGEFDRRLVERIAARTASVEIKTQDENVILVDRLVS